LFQR
jgi:DNA-directed RNA polymerase